MAPLHRAARFIVLTLLGVSELAAAQIYTLCNPIINTTCPADPALGTTFAWDFRNGASDSFSTDSWWLPFIRYDSINGATMTVNRSGVAPTLTSNFYIMFGRLDVVIKTATGTGMVTDVIFESDDQDEIDLEWVATSPRTVQSNYYSPRGRWPVYNQMQLLTTAASMQTQFRTYTVDWNADRLSWYIDGVLMRTVNSTGNDQYPQTPMKITMGLWAGGDSGNSPYTVYWAGGYTNYSNGPFEMSVQSIKITDYSSGSAYLYGDRTGLWGSIQAVNGSVRPRATTAANSNVVSTFRVPASLLPPSVITPPSSIITKTPTLPTIFSLLISSDGRCGETANSTTCAGSLFGNCCSAYGYCGSGAEYCGDGCLQYFGLCGNQTYTPLPTTKTAVSILSLPTDLPILGVSPGGYCGLSNGSTTCLTSDFGDCCSQYDSCGSGSDWCGLGCQPSFGNCIGYPNKTLPSSLRSTTLRTPSTLKSLTAAQPTNIRVSGVSTGGYCGVSNGSTTCTGSGFGSCCSQWDSCGNTDDYCGAGCQPAFGSCNGIKPDYPLSSSTLMPTSIGTSSPSSLIWSIPSSVTSLSPATTQSAATGRNTAIASSSNALVVSTSCSTLISSVFSSLASLPSSTVLVTLPSTSISKSVTTSTSSSALSPSLMLSMSSTPTMTSNPVLSPGATPNSVLSSTLSLTSPSTLALISKLGPTLTLNSSITVNANSYLISTSPLSSTSASTSSSTSNLSSVSSLSPPVASDTSVSSYSSTNIAATSVANTYQSANSSYSSSDHAVTQQAASTTIGSSSIAKSSSIATYLTMNSSASTTASTKPGTISSAAYNSTTSLRLQSTSTPTASSSSSAPTTLTTFVCPTQDGASYLSPYSSPNKVYKLLCNSDLSTANTIGMGWGGGSSILRCIQYCEAKPGCVAVTYAPWLGSGACYYKGSVGTIKSVTNASLAILTGTQPASTTSKAGIRRRWMAW